MSGLPFLPSNDYDPSTRPAKLTSPAAKPTSRRTTPGPPPSAAKPSTSDGLRQRASSNRKIRLTLQPLKMLEADVNSYEPAVLPDTPSRGLQSSGGSSVSPPNLLALSQLYQERNRMLNLVPDGVRPERHSSPTALAAEPAAAQQSITSRPRKLEPMPNAFAAAVEESHNKWLLNSRSIDNGTRKRDTFEPNENKHLPILP